MAMKYQIFVISTKTFSFLSREKRISLLVRLAVEQWLGPSQAQARQKCNDECDDDGCNVGVDLELKELSHSVVHATAQLAPT